ncbi:secretin N-terminal domain-containing protein [Granulosicoccaceae sp. 1_MG-2023]|nr:secretin N-terminal domain-containing protein [Granulosicoccaceae sp. 1_MG-2023]
MLRKLLLALLLSLAATGALSAAGGRFELNLLDTPVYQAFEILGELGEVSIVVSNKISGNVSVRLYENSVDAAIRTVASAAGVEVERRGEGYFIVTADEVGQHRVSDVTQVRSFHLQYVDPENAVELLEPYLSRYGRMSVVDNRDTLVVSDRGDFLDRISRVIDEVDKEPRQVLIEAEILEIALTDEETFGVDWTSRRGDSSYGADGLTGAANRGFFMQYLTRDLDVYIDALSQSGRVRTLSTPKLVVLEDRDAEVIIGDRIGYKVTTTIDAVTTESVEFVESGVILRVRANVDNKDRIMLEVHPEVSSGTVTDGIPSVSTTEVTTHLIADDGQPLLIGGLIKNARVERESGVPGLRSIPLLGALFSENEERFNRSETILVMRPHIVRGDGSPQMDAAVTRADRLGSELLDQGSGATFSQDLNNGLPDSSGQDSLKAEEKDRQKNSNGIGWMFGALFLALLL